MKNSKTKLFKRIFAAIICAACATAFAAALSACKKDEGDGENKLSGEMTVVIANADSTVVKSYKVDLSKYDDKASVADLLEDLSKDAANDFYYGGYDSQYGLYLTEVGYTTVTHHEAQGGYEAYDSTNYNAVAKEDKATYAYVAYYNNITDCSSSDWSTVTYGGATLGYSNYGASNTPLESGKIVYFTQG